MAPQSRKSGGSGSGITNGSHAMNRNVLGFIMACAAMIGMTMFKATPLILNSAGPLDMMDMPSAMSNINNGGAENENPPRAKRETATRITQRNLGDDENHDDDENDTAKKIHATTQQQQRQQQQHDDGSTTTRSKPLNIVLLYADDWSFTSLGASGNEYIQTPQLDRMAKNGMLFTHNCVTTSICMVSRATLYTGQYASRHNTWKSYQNLTMFEGDNWEHSLYPLLKKAGYHTGFFGKWHHHDPPKHIPTFDKRLFYQTAHYKERNGVVKHITEWNEIDGMNYLRSRPVGQPFMLTISFFATHAEDGGPEQYRPMNSSMWMYANTEVPHPKTFTDEHFQALPPFLQKSANYGRGRSLKRYYPEEKYQHMMKNTYRMASEVDATCGRIIDELERQGILNETMVIFTTDNGNFHGQHGLAEKWYSFQESLMVPLVIQDPRMPATATGTKTSEFSLNIDLAPTILRAAQIDIPQRMQGRDMAQLYLDPTEAERTWRKEFFYEWFGPHDHLPSNLALVRKDKKLMSWPQYDVYQLFDLEADPYEEADLLAKKDETTAAAARALTQEETERITNEMKSRMAELAAAAKAGAKL
eukprot:CAMPEP_0119555294 /NCGR_PEP_ID=MMETSP1352-20130426/7557_1 /TAXON_ID=265584 /ORGANISM="Stauroneis constricta, Strain CCMP1120" /LENGTH=587 /DNA_ID=CAMNT_0007602035 /DNA_START=114 /DNA_END=1877 /DNA_ORIENTATION=-